jgi:DNA adenine methylase
LRPSSTRPGPFVKWAGGKSQLLDHIVPLVPGQFRRYHEPFVGGGALFFALASQGRIAGAILNDLNADLACVYEVIKGQPEHLIEILRGIERRFKACRNQSEFYYNVRNSEPCSRIERAARFIFLNKTCYNGLYRVNKKGKFNVPFGRYKNPSIYDQDNIRLVSEALISVNISSAPFQEALRVVEKDDFVYLDPPYQPVSSTANFTGYTAGRFHIQDQEELAQEFDRMHRLGAKVLLSNSDHEVIERLYSGKGYATVEVKANRQINCDATKRGPIAELLVRNY